MILQEEFKKSGYQDILAGDIASKYGFDLADLFEAEHKPEELLSIFISGQQDELFFLLDGDLTEINNLCERWDIRIRVFSIINENSKAFQKLKYNIVQLIVYSGETPDKSSEGNLMTTRKIIIKGNMADKNQIEIGDDEAIELPFHMIPEDAFEPDAGKIEYLGQLLPKDAALLALMQHARTKVKRKESRTFEVQDYEMIKEWLIR